LFELALLDKFVVVVPDAPAAPSWPGTSPTMAMAKMANAGLRNRVAREEQSADTIPLGVRRRNGAT
jgi:hypothetical protein